MSMFEVIFLFVLALIFIIFAVVQDLRSREIANWLNWSLIIFALGFRFFYSLFSGEWNFVLQGIIGFGIFFVLGNALYYSHVFAGGDAKLMIALGAILPFSNNLFANLKIFILFFFLFLIVGAIYGLIMTVIFSFRKWRDFRKEFFKRFRKGIWLICGGLVFSIGVLCLSFMDAIFIWLGLILFVLPYLYFYSKAVDEVCMVREVSVLQLTEGDWLYEDVKVKGKVIKANWDGLDIKDIELLKKEKKKVLVRYGIQFAPVFLISFLILGIGVFFNLIEKIFWFFI